MANYINNYGDAADYSADDSGRAALGKSTVSLESDSGKVHFDGVNVVVSLPKQGDAVYVPTTSVYSAATPGSGVTEGSVTFVAGDTVDNAKMTAAGFTALGVVATVKGNKCYVLYKTLSAAVRFCSENTISDYIVSGTDLAKVTAGDLTRIDGTTGHFSSCNVDILFAWLTGNGGVGKDSGWNGGTNGAQHDFLNGADWGLTLGPGASAVTAHDAEAYDVAAKIKEFGEGAEGFRKYLESRIPDRASSASANVIAFKDGKDATKVFVDANDSSNSAYFPPAQFAYNHNTEWGSYGNFANVDGLRRGDWFMPGLGIMQDIFSRVLYTLESPATDVYNKTLAKIGGSALTLNTNANESKYRLPFVRSRTSAQNLYFQGYFDSYMDALRNVCRVLSVALVEF